jgi:hypothetical protein
MLFCRVIRGRADGISPRRQNALHFARRSCCTVKQLDASAFYAHTVLQYAPRCALPQPRLCGAGCGENETPFSFGIALVLGIDVIEAHVCAGPRVMVQLAILSTIAPGSFASLNTSKSAQSLRPPSCIRDAFYLIRWPPAAEPAIVPTIYRRTLLCTQALPLPLADSGPIGANQRFPGQLRTLGAARRTKEPRRQLRGRRIKERASIEQ